MASNKSKKTLQDLASIRDQLPLENKRVKHKPKPKKPSSAKTAKWPQPGNQIPLQVLKLDDLEILYAQSQSQYEQLFEQQEILSSVLSILDFETRRKKVDSLIKDEQTKKERPNQKTEFEKILIRINKDHRRLSDGNHRLRVQEEISKLEDQRIRKVLESSVQADNETWQPLYEELNQRVRLLACEVDTQSGERKKAVVKVQYPWRARVGGLQGFRERLLPIMHPVYGIPYVPASSIKGILRSWARESGKDTSQINHLFGFLDGTAASMAAIEIIDAFPSGPSLSLDVATPQWSWQGNDVTYGPAPHQMLSLENLTINIGLTYTSRGNETDVKIALDWLAQTLSIKGLGSRVSAGYGQAELINIPLIEEEQLSTDDESHLTSKNQEINSHLRSEHCFKLWSQGMSGADSSQREFRPAAVRGMLRYWFRAVALGLYTPQHCMELEARLFGTIEPKAVQGSVVIKAQFEEDLASLDDPKIPHYVSGTVVLEAKDKRHLTLIQHVLKLAIHLGGVGRGTRRPLHWNDDDRYSGLRGCYWQPEEKDRLDCNRGIWQNFIRGLKDSFINVQQPDPAEILSLGDPGEPGNRHQDVLNSHAEIFLVPSPEMIHPNQISGSWSKNGMSSAIRGQALEFLYSSSDYKGKNRKGIGNEFVGGKLGTPSFVWIASNNLNIPRQSYQVVTVFSIDQSSSSSPKGRQQFVENLQNTLTVIPVWNA